MLQFIQEYEEIACLYVTVLLFFWFEYEDIKIIETKHKYTGQCPNLNTQS